MEKPTAGDNELQELQTCCLKTYANTMLRTQRTQRCGRNEYNMDETNTTHAKVAPEATLTKEETDSMAAATIPVAVGVSLLETSTVTDQRTG